MAEGHRERLRKRLLTEDIDEIPDYVVLEMLLTGVIQRRDTCELARALIKEFGSFHEVAEAPFERLKNFPGMGEAAATHIKLMLKFYRKYRLSKWQEGKKNTFLENSAHIRDFIVDKFIGCDKEELLVVCMDAQEKVIHVERLSKGSVNAVSVSVAEIVQIALLRKAAMVIVAHNHVIGDALPSIQDLETTRAISEALDSINVILRDHVIVCDDEYISVYDAIEELKGRANGKI